MNKVKPLIVAMLLILLASHSFGGNPNQDDSSLKVIAEALKAKYKKNKKTEFDNFHEQYIVLWSMNFPLFKTNPGMPVLPHSDINSPVELLKYDTEVKAYNEKMNSVAVGYKQSRTDILSSQYREKNRRTIKDTNAFIKQGYYKYFISELENNANKNTFVDICVTLNRDLIKLNSTNTFIPYSQELAHRKRLFKELLTVLDHKEYSQEIDYSSGCFARLNVSKKALDHLYGSELISTILHPEILLRNPVKISGF